MKVQKLRRCGVLCAILGSGSCYSSVAKELLANDKDLASGQQHHL